MTLTELYNLKLTDYKLDELKDHPAKLLAMLLLPIKDNFEPLTVSEGEFYERYKSEIDEKIKQIEQDFNFTKEEFINLIEEKGVSYDEYEEDKLWFIFAEGFGALHWSLMYQPNKTPEEIYTFYFDEDFLLITPLSKYQKLYNACHQFHATQLPNHNQYTNFNINKHANHITKKALSKNLAYLISNKNN